MTSIPRLGTLAIAGGVALLSAACTFSIDTSESVTESYDVEDFDRLQISSAFDATVSVGEATSVEITVDTELLDRVEVEVVDGRLIIGLGGGIVQTSGALDIAITTPELTEIEVDGAVEIDVDGIAAEDFVLNVGGAADVEAAGTIDRLTLTSSGASNVDLEDLTVGTATVDIDGASSVTLTGADEVNGTISGASSIDVPKAGTIDIDESGASSIDMVG